MMRSVCLIHYTAGPAVSQLFTHSFNKHLMLIYSLIEPYWAPAWTKDPEANAAPGLQQV